MTNKIFNESDYNSNGGMVTSIWGPSLWHSLHTISFNYPIKPTKEQKQEYKDFFISLKNVLPCRFCRDNYKMNLKKYPINSKILKNRETLSRWLYNLHEYINTNLDKKSGLTYDEVRDRYEHFRSRCINEPTNIKEKCTNNKNNKEKGCIEPLYGIKSKCILNIVPKDLKTDSFNIDKKCNLTKK